MMRNPQGRDSPPRIDLGDKEIRLGGWRALMLIASVVFLSAAITYSIICADVENALYEAIAGALMVLAPLVIGILLAPERKPTDYSIVAVQAISELEELMRGTQALVEELQLIDVQHDGARAQFVITKNIEELHRQHERLGRGAGHWAEVSPRVGSLFKEKEERHRNMLLAMEEARKGEGT